MIVYYYHQNLGEQNKQVIKMKKEKKFHMPFRICLLESLDQLQQP